MRKLVVPSLTILLLTLACSARAEALVQTLPADRTWVGFHVVLKEQDRETTPTWYLRSVGGKLVDGKKCRWIELQSREFDQTLNKERNVILYKVLVAESEFGAGKNPLSKALKVWVKAGDEDPREVESIAAADPYLSLVIGGPVAGVKKLDQKEPVDWQEGRLQCDVLSGASRTEFGQFKVEVTHRVCRHNDVPFGIAAAKQEFKVSFGTQSTGGSVDFTLKAIGKDAKSELPSVE